jgi:hypothetical protein
VYQQATPGAVPRHPDDPDVVRDSKSVAVLVLGIVGLLTAPLVGGIVPATLALYLARVARTEMIAAGGFLSGERAVRIGTRLAWAAIIVAAAALVAVIVWGLVGLGGGTSQDLDPNVD